LTSRLPEPSQRGDRQQSRHAFATVLTGRRNKDYNSNANSQMVFGSTIDLQCRKSDRPRIFCHQDTIGEPLTGVFNPLLMYFISFCFLNSWIRVEAVHGKTAAGEFPKSGYIFG
jgi:hypothetical protein